MPDNIRKSPNNAQGEKSYYQMRCEFYEKFKSKIKPQIRFYEERRKKELKEVHTTLAIFIILGIILLFTPFLQLGIFCFAIAFFWDNWQNKGFEKKIKNIIMPLVCSCYGDLKWYNGGIDAALFKKIFITGRLAGFSYRGDVDMLNNSLIVPRYDLSTYDDIFEGTYKNIPFEIIEAKYTKEEGSGRSRTVITVFDGVIIKFKIDKRFNCHTVIRPDSFFHSSPSGRLIHTELEDVNFEKKFDVFCDDEIEARYLITPSFMERLTNLKTAFFADKISCSFYKGYLFVALHTPKDLFTMAKLNIPLDDFSQYETFHNEIISILKLIDHFKLNENTGL